jgi:hypothetical protein
VALVDSARFMVFSTLTSAQSVGSDVWRSGELRATEAGTLTVSVQYAMSHTGIPTNLTNFIVHGGPRLVLGDRTVLVHGGDIHSNGTETGTLSVSRDFTQGKVITLIVGAREVASVPVATLAPLKPVGLTFAPDGNPFNDRDKSIRSKVWAYGLRNPFRFDVHPTTGMPFIGDAGWISWEEINKGVPGANYGWPCWEGNGQLPSYQASFPTQC